MFQGNSLSGTELRIRFEKCKNKIGKGKDNSVSCESEEEIEKYIDGLQIRFFGVENYLRLTDY
jgi:hypothetical protein